MPPDKFAKDLVDSLMYSLLAPKIAWQGWESAYPFSERGGGPPHIALDVKLQRMLNITEIFRDEEATLLETFCFTATASLAFPFREELFEMHMWLAFQVLPPELGLAQALNHGDMPYKVGAPLSPGGQALLTNTRRWIFKTQMTELARRRKAEKEVKDGQV